MKLAGQALKQLAAGCSGKDLADQESKPINLKSGSDHWANLCYYVICLGRTFSLLAHNNYPLTAVAAM
jgi:hypothetical protein